MAVNIDIRTKFGCRPKIWPEIQTDRYSSKMYGEEVEVTCQWLWLEWQLTIGK